MTIKKIAPSHQCDVLFIEPDSSQSAYQELSKTFSAIETPTWSLLLAQSCRSKGFGVSIIDCTAEHLSDQATIKKVQEIDPRLIVVVLYGQNPNSGTTNMIGGTRLAKELKLHCPEIPICFVGSHVSALPKEVLTYSFVDFVLLNEGVYALHNLLKSDLKNNLNNLKGIGWKKNNNEIILNEPERVVPQELMDVDLPGYAWDLLPYKEKPFDLYRAHFWHADFDHNKRTPFAAIYTSLGCRFACSFCMINILNRTNNDDNISAADSRGMRFWSSEFIFKEFEKLASMGVQTLRLSDEMFFLDKRYYEPLLKSIIQKELKFSMWAYSRVDTVRSEYLPLLKKAGINWLALGIEAGNQNVRKEVSKGSFKEINIRDAVKEIQNNDINIIANYIFGFPEDTLDSMNETLDLALELNTEMANMYPCQALPGSYLYQKSKQANLKLPSTYEGFSFLSYESEPMSTKTVSAAEVLKFRDNAWEKYFKNPRYLELVKNKFGETQKNNIIEMTKIKLKRKLLGD